MKKAFSIFAAMVLTGAIGSAAMAQSAPIKPGEVARFDRGYLDEHPEVAGQLAANPKLVDNRKYVSAHPGLKSYLAGHPGVRGALEQHPRRFMSGESQYAGGAPQYNDWEPQYTGGEPQYNSWGGGNSWAGSNGVGPLANTGSYLAQYPQVAQQVNAYPGLIDNPTYIVHHPGLREFLATHRIAREEWKCHPARFIHSEDRYSQNH